MLNFWTSERKIYPPFFRVAIGVVLLIELLLNYTSSHSFLYNTEIFSFVSESKILSFLRLHNAAFYMAFAFVLIAFIFGIGKNFVALLVFVFLILYQKMNPSLDNWGETILRYSMLYFVFVDSFNRFTYNKFTSTQSDNKISNYLSQLAIWSIILHIFLIYINNGFFKLFDSEWKAGNATAYAFGQEIYTSKVATYITQNKIAAKSLTYITWAQQILFVPMVLLNRKTRFFIILLAILIHLTMFFLMNLWRFELALVLLLGFILTDNDWKTLRKKKLKFN